MIEYLLPPDYLSNGATQYTLTCRVCTVHRQEEPILLTIGPASKDDPSTVHTIKLPYTMGLWEETEPVIVELGGSASTLRFARPKQMFGFAFKDIRLVPV